MVKEQGKLNQLAAAGFSTVGVGLVQDCVNDDDDDVDEEHDQRSERPIPFFIRICI